MERLTTRCSGYAVMAWEHEEKHTTQEWIDMLTDRLAAYEDTGLTPEEIRNALDVNDIIPEINVTVDHIRDLLKAEQDGRLLELPFVAMVEQSLQDGKMKTMGDQKHNGRYAVVYVDHMEILWQPRRQSQWLWSNSGRCGWFKYTTERRESGNEEVRRR